MIEQVQSMFSRKRDSPKNILGFFGTLLAIWVVGSCTAIIALAKSRTETRMIPWIWGFAALFLLIMYISVFVVMLKNTSKLMLGNVTGSEFIAIQRNIKLGDSESGLREVVYREVGGHLLLEDSSVEISDVTPGGTESGEDV